ncbi:MAG: hypothetical protein QOI15_2575 [Pseudonocardiales bacterium]|nr:hypothetical protein [Pseudonocardiales bacterium]
MSGRKRAAALVVALLTLLVGLSVTAAASSAKAPPPYGHHHQARAACTPFKPAVGGSITMNGQGFLPHDHIVITLHSKVTTLGSVNADANGNFHKVLQLPSGVSGEHTVVATGTAGPPRDQATCRFVIGGRGSGGQGNGGDNHGGGSSNTGVQVLGISLLGLVLIVGGWLFVLSARRRRTAETD